MRQQPKATPDYEQALQQQLRQALAAVRHHRRTKNATAESQSQRLAFDVTQELHRVRGELAPPPPPPATDDELFAALVQRVRAFPLPLLEQLHDEVSDALGLERVPRGPL